MSARKGQDYQALAKWENPERPTGVGSSRYDPLDQPPSSAMSANFVSHHSNEPLRMRGQAASGSRRGNDDALHPHQASVPGDDVDVGPYGHLDHGSGDGMRHTTKPATSTAFSEGAAQSHLGVSKQLGGDASWASSKEKRSDSTNRTAVSQGPVRLAFRPLSKAELEADDRLHDLSNIHRQTSRVSMRGFGNVFVLVSLVVILFMLFAGYPMLSFFLKRKSQDLGTYGLGGSNGTGQVPVMASNMRLVDTDTPENAKKWTNLNGQPYHLVFSDEFNVEGRTFWPGDDPFWEAVDIWYGATGDYEWYTPEQINTTKGDLLITMDNKPMNNLNFRSGMLQSWNKFCFQGGYIEFNAVLPGSPTQVGWWPGLWLEGNLCRAGYLGTSHGMWPYSYSGCDSGILANQTAPGKPRYDELVTMKGAYSGNRRGISWLSGMRASSCTCADEDHPGPNHNIARSGPEIDVLEAQIIDKRRGGGSQSLQIAPFDFQYEWDQDKATIQDSGTEFNSYKGGVYQEALSAVARIPDRGYVHSSNQYVTYGVDYEPDWDLNGGGRVTWYVDGKPTWTLTGASIPARPDIDIGQRNIPTEPMSIILNLGISRGFQSDLDFDTLTFPATFRVDYVRIYQSDASSHDRVSCDPPDHPTKAYIERHKDVYYNRNYTIWPKDWPKNEMAGC